MTGPVTGLVTGSRAGMVHFDRVTVGYPDASAPVLRDVDLDVDEGELLLVAGSTGSGKSTLLRAVNGLVPHFTGGTLSGRVTVAGRDTRTHRPRDLADVVGVVGQDPLATFVTDTVEDELAYGMESLGVPGDVMRTRVEETLDLLGLVSVRRRVLTGLSGGERQRVAIGAVLTMHPKVLVLDEPTSALDPQAAEEVLAAVHRLVHDLGLTVLLAEHRLERVVQYADRVAVVNGDGRVVAGPPAAIMASAPVAPPVVELARVVGWDPPPLTVRDARRAAAPLRQRLTEAPPPRRGHATGRPLVAARDLVAGYGRRNASGARPALAGIDVAVAAGEVVAVLGRNGAGKSTLLRTLVGLTRPWRGSVRIDGLDPHAAPLRDTVRAVGLVPQEPGDVLYAETVAAECRQADADLGAAPGTCAGFLRRLAPELPPDRHPRDLSEGQRLSLALAVVLAGQPAVVLLDEPTRGLDYGAKRRLAEILRGLADGGRAVLFATHDVELVAELATRVVVLADGEVVADATTADAVLASPMFAPQVAKIVRPLPWLTVDEVARTLAGASASGTPGDRP